jgi:hypothetical protein
MRKFLVPLLRREELSNNEREREQERSLGNVQGEWRGSESGQGPPLIKKKEVGSSKERERERKEGGFYE